MEDAKVHLPDKQNSNRSEKDTGCETSPTACTTKTVLRKHGASVHVCTSRIEWHSGSRTVPSGILSFSTRKSWPLQCQLLLPWSNERSEIPKISLKSPGDHPHIWDHRVKPYGLQASKQIYPERERGCCPVKVLGTKLLRCKPFKWWIWYDLIRNVLVWSLAFMETDLSSTHLPVWIPGRKAQFWSARLRSSNHQKSRNPSSNRLVQQAPWKRECSAATVMTSPQRNKFCAGEFFVKNSDVEVWRSARRPIDMFFFFFLFQWLSIAKNPRRSNTWVFWTRSRTPVPPRTVPPKCLEQSNFGQILPWLS